MVWFWCQNLRNQGRIPICLTNSATRRHALRSMNSALLLAGSQLTESYGSPKFPHMKSFGLTILDSKYRWFSHLHCWTEYIAFWCCFQGTWTMNRYMMRDEPDDGTQPYHNRKTLTLTLNSIIQIGYWTTRYWIQSKTEKDIYWSSLTGKCVHVNK
jgi:hypothetical protein